MALTTRSLTRLTLFTLAATIFWTTGLFYQRYESIPTQLGWYNWKHWDGFLQTQRPLPVLESLSLTDEQCRTTFPGLTKEIDDAVARGPFDFEIPGQGYQGLIQAMLKNGKLYILSVSRDVAQHTVRYRTAILHALHRAIITSPSTLPDTVFSLCLNDQPRPGSWSFSRPRKSTPGNFWLMPHFGYWTWPAPYIGPMDEALAKIKRVESETPWESKIDKAVWRGTAGFNPINNHNLRPNLLTVAAGKQWADVEKLVVEGVDNPPTNVLSIEDFCRYKYIIYTEGITYSGRLPYHQACSSVIITPPLTFFQHTSHLMHPVSSFSLLPSSHPSSPVGPGGDLVPVTASTDDQPVIFPREDANAVAVPWDWSNLEETILYLQANPDVAKGIAHRQRRLMVDDGYLSPAAEACYWRALIKGWSQVANTTHLMEEDGTRWETFSVTAKLGPGMV